MLPRASKHNHAFTLIELSIVLVIIGLIVGGLMTGRDLIKAAEARSLISQIEKYNASVHTFRGKFNSLPGDMPIADAQQYGFTVGNSCIGQGGGRDGNGAIEGYPSATAPLAQVIGETGLFWADITNSIAGNILDGHFPAASATFPGCVDVSAPVLVATMVPLYFPSARMGNGNYIYVYYSHGLNWWGISAVKRINVAGQMNSDATLPVNQIYNIDKKLDDGVPTTGTVVAFHLNGSNTIVQNSPNASSDTNTSCYNYSGGTYSTGYNGGNGANCGVSFRFH